MVKFITATFKMGDTARKIKNKNKYTSIMELDPKTKGMIDKVGKVLRTIEIPLKATLDNGVAFKTIGIIQSINDDECTVSLNETAYEKYKNTDQYRVVAFFRNDESSENNKLRIARFELVRANIKLGK